MLGTAQIERSRDATMHRAAAGDCAMHDDDDHAAPNNGQPVVPVARSERPVVLVADDSPANRMVAFELLSRMGIKPLLAADGAEAVALASEVPLTLILMDLRMPVLDGYAATWQIRRFERAHARKRVPVVAYTSMDVAADQSMLRDIGIDAVLPKLGDAQAFRDCVMHWCSQIDTSAMAGGRVPATPQSPSA
jgi:CheY-like chemotaxis protein